MAWLTDDFWLTDNAFIVDSPENFGENNNMAGLEFYAASGTAASAGVFIPVSDLPGVVAGEFGAGESSAKKEAKFCLSFFNSLMGLPASTLGLSCARSDSTPGVDLRNQQYTVTGQFYANHNTRALAPIPVPGSGANSGIGDVSIVDIFPNAEKVAASGSISGEGVVIVSADVKPYFAPAHASISIANDSRDWFMGVCQFLAVNATIRATGVLSAITAKSRGATNAVALPTAATATTDPTTGILAADLPQSSFFSHTASVTIQTKEDQATQTFDVNVV